MANKKMPADIADLHELHDVSTKEAAQLFELVFIAITKLQAEAKEGTAESKELVKEKIEEVRALVKTAKEEGATAIETLRETLDSLVSAEDVEERILELTQTIEAVQGEGAASHDSLKKTVEVLASWRKTQVEQTGAAQDLARRALLESQRNADDLQALRENIAGIKLKPGERGPRGLMPEHEWEGTKLRLEQPDGEWGDWTDLQGLPGLPGGGDFGVGMGGVRRLRAGTGIIITGDPGEPIISAIGGGTGSVTTVSVVTADGVSGSVANPTTTPAITITLGAITPISVAASGTVTGSNLSGNNTGDQTSIAGLTGTKAQFDTALTDGNFLYVGDVAWGSIGGTLSNQTDLQAALDAKVSYVGAIQDISFATGSPRQITIDLATGGATGDALTMKAGSGDGAGDGGHFTLLGGDRGAMGTFGGDVVLRPGQGNSTANDGHVSIQNPTSGNAALFDTALLTLGRTYIFPDAGGTVALVGTQTLSAVLTQGNDAGIQDIINGANITLNGSAQRTISVSPMPDLDTGGSALNLIAGMGNGIGNGGSSNVNGGDGGSTGNGGTGVVTGGLGGLTSGNGGLAILSGGGAQTSGNGGDVLIFPGLGAGAGTLGRIMLSPNGGGINAILSLSALTVDRTYAFPDQSGTLLIANSAITGATKTKITYDAKGLVTAGADATTADIADSSNRRYVTDAQLVVIGNTSGVNTGNQTSIVGITGTKAQFDTALTDGNFLYVGDITQYTDEMAQDAVGAMVDGTLVYVDGTPLLTRAALTGDVTAPQASNATTLATVNSNVGSFGSASSVATFTVNGKGLTTAAANVAIAIASTAVTDFTEAAQDAIGAMIDTSLVYVDGTPLFTRAALTGDITAPQGSNATTLATVNANVGAFNNANITVNAKGLITAASTGSGGAAKEAVVYATTAALPTSVYANGTAGVGATLTGVSVGLLSVDGTGVVNGNRLLIKNQAAALENGIYTVTAAGSVSGVFILTRATDSDQTADYNPGESSFVIGGVTLLNTSWGYNGIDNPTMGTTALTYVYSGGAPGGANTQVQFNDNGVLGGSSNVTIVGTKLTATQMASPSWNPAAGTTFTTTGDNTDFVFAHNALGLNKGRVYVVGGDGVPGSANTPFAIRTGTGATDHEMGFGIQSATGYGWIRARRPGTGELELRLQPEGGTVKVGAGGLTPLADDGSALGTTALKWADLFLASGGVINWNAGNATLTHSTGLLTSNVDIVVPDEVYGAGWNGSNEVPTKNAVYDQLVFLISVAITRTRVTTTGNVTMGAVAATDYTYLRNGEHTITFPTAVGNNNRYTIKNRFTTLTIPRTTSAQTIDGRSQETNSQNELHIYPNESYDFQSDGSNWFTA